jgi:hypothetical protein
VQVSPQHAQAFQTPAWADATPQPTIAVASARFSLQIMHVTVFTAQRRLAPAASSETASSSRRIPVSCIIVKESRAERPRGSQRGYPCRKTAILVVTTRRWLSPRSFTRPPVGIPCGLLSAGRRRSGLPRFVSITRSVRSRLDAGGQNVHATGYFSL